MILKRWLVSIVVGAVWSRGLAAQSMLVTDSVSSPGLASNVVGDSPVRRTLIYLPPSYARAARRALVGHSMGGFGALAIGFNRPDVFGLIYAISPCCIGLVGRLNGPDG